MTKKIHFFNMIEVLLALSIIAFGMTSILGLFPVGLTASREAIAQNCSADVSDQLITYLRVTNEINLAQYGRAFYESGCFFTNVTVDADGELPDESSGNSNYEKYVNTNSEDFLEAYLAKRIESNLLNADGSIDFERVASGWPIFKVDGVTNKPRVFFIIQGPNCAENDTASAAKLSRPVDFSAMALVWKSPVQTWRENPDGTGNWDIWPSFAAGDPDVTKYEYSGKLNIELSWPLNLPYNERRKRYYQVIINRPPDPNP